MVAEEVIAWIASPLDPNQTAFSYEFGHMKLGPSLELERRREWFLIPKRSRNY